MTRDQEREIFERYATRRSVALVEAVEEVARGMKVRVDEVWEVLSESRFADDARFYRGGFGYEEALRPEQNRGGVGHEHD